MIGRWFALLFVLVALPFGAANAAVPPSAEGTYVIPSFAFRDGETLANLRMHYATLGTPRRGATGRVTNAVLVLHGTGGDTHQFLREQFAGVLFNAGQTLDAATYFIIIPDGIGHGKSSKPSDGLHARFPHYGYRDMVDAVHAVLVDGLHVDHLRLVMGTSMGGMQTWLWGETYPMMMDALMPLASLPQQIGGRNRIWRDMIVDDIKDDPGYYGGEYNAQPYGLRTAVDMLYVFGSAPLYNQTQYPTRDTADAYYEKTVKPRIAGLDANDTIYQFEASRDYDPEPALATIVAPLQAVNSADDQINPPELGHPRARHRARQERQSGRPADHELDARPWHAHVASRLGLVPHRFAGAQRRLGPPLPARHGRFRCATIFYLGTNLLPFIARRFEDESPALFVSFGPLYRCARHFVDQTR